MAELLQTPIAFDVEIERKPLTTPKPNVLKRLESWKSPETSKADIENRINAANTKREESMNLKTGKITERLSKVATNQNVLQSTHEQVLEDKAKALAEKMSTATIRHETATKAVVSKVATHNTKITKAKEEVFSSTTQKAAELASAIDQKLTVASSKYDEHITSVVSKVATHNAKVSEAKEEVFSITNQKAAELASVIDQKQNVAATNYEQTVAEKIMKTSTHNDEVKRAHVRVMSDKDEKTNNISYKTAAMVENATTARQNIITNKVMTVGQQTRDKTERGKQAMAVKNERRVQIQTNLDEKTEAAVAKRDNILMEKVQKSATKKRSPTNNTIKAEDITFKMNEAAARRETLLLQRAEAAGHKNDKVKEVSNLVKSGGTPTRRVATPGKKFHNAEEPLPTGDSIVEDAGHEVLEEQEQGQVVEDLNSSVMSEDGTNSGCVIN